MYKAYVTQGARNLVPDEVEPAELQKGQVRLKVKAVGICGSDHHIYLGHHPYVRYPTIQGHEFVGVIEEFGPGCERVLPVGSQVVVEPLIGCGKCYACSLGRYNCCEDLKILGVHVPGAFQEKVVVPETALHPVTDVPAEIAVFAEPLSIAIQAVRRAKVNQADTVLVLGSGPIGLATVLACKKVGAKVVITDLVESRLEKARNLGADLALQPSDDAAQTIRDWSQGGVTVVIDAVAVEPAMRLGVEVLRSAGRFVLVGISRNQIPISIGTVVAKEIDIIGSRNSADVFPDAVALMRENAEKIRTLIHPSPGLDTLPEMMEFSIGNPAAVEKVVIVM